MNCHSWWFCWHFNIRSLNILSRWTTLFFKIFHGPFRINRCGTTSYCNALHCNDCRMICKFIVFIISMHKFTLDIVFWCINKFYIPTSNWLSQWTTSIESVIDIQQFCTHCTYVYIIDLILSVLHSILSDKVQRKQFQANYVSNSIQM